MKKINVVMICPDFFPRNTGYSNAFVNLCNALSNSKRYAVHVVTSVGLQGAMEIEIPGVTVHRIQPFKTKFLRFVLNQRQIARYVQDLAEKENVSLILQETMTDMLVPLFLPHELRQRHAVRIHGCFETERRYFYPGLTNLVSRWLSSLVSRRFVKNFISTNRYHIDFIKEKFLKGDYYQQLHKEFFVLPNTIEPQRRKTEILDDSSNTLRVFTLGRMDHSGYHQKGFQDLIMALSVLEREEQSPKLEVEIVGDGEYQEKLVSLSQSLSLKNVWFEKRLSHEEVMLRLETCDLVVLPSRYEGMSMFALEAISTGNAVVFSKNTGLADMCINNVNGRIFEARDVNELAACISYVSASRQRARELGENSRKLYENRFRPEMVEKKLRNIVAAIGAVSIR